MPVTRTTSTFGPGGYGTVPANVPGTPVFSTNEQFSVTTGNQTLILKRAGTSAVVTMSSGAYSYANMDAELTSSIDTAFSVSNTTVTYSSVDTDHQTKFTIGATTGITWGYVQSGSSNAGTLLGFDADTSTGSTTIISQDFVHGVNTITFTFSNESNSTDVTFAVFEKSTSKYLGLDGRTQGAATSGGGGEIWATFANWDNGGTSGMVTFQDAVDYTSYQFKAKARNATNVETIFSAWSAVMNSFPNLDFSDPSEELSREIPTGNTKIIQSPSLSTTFVSSVAVNPTVVGSFGAIKSVVVMQNCLGTTSRLTMAYSEVASSTASTTSITWTTNVTDMFTLTTANNVLTFGSTITSSGTDVTVTTGAYNTATSQATALQIALNATTGLTTGGTTFAVSYTTGQLYQITAEGNLITYHNFTATNTGGFTFGFTESNTIGSTSLLSTSARGESIRSLSSSSSGISHDVYWNSYEDAGESERKTSLVRLRFTPYDASPSGGDAGAVVDTASFTVDNRSVAVTVYNADKCFFGKDTTPTFRAPMAAIRGGNQLYHRIKIWNNADILQLSKLSAINVAGWDYEKASSTGIDISFDGKTITRSTTTNSFIEDGWTTGMSITIVGSDFNDGAYSGKSTSTVNALTMTLGPTVTFTTETSGETIRLSNYVDVTTTGINPQWINGTNSVRYTVQAADALSQDNDDPYAVKMAQAEIRSRS